MDSRHPPFSTATSLGDLLNMLLSCDTTDDSGPCARCDREWTRLPVFGGEEPGDTSGVWSWDADDLLVGSCRDELEIISRQEWEERNQP